MPLLRYEWDVEAVEVDGEDIIEHHHADRLREYKRGDIDPAAATQRYALPTFMRLVLVRDVFTEDEGLRDRQWAYVKDDGTLPAHFDWCGGEKGATIPPRFRGELKRWLEGGAA